MADATRESNATPNNATPGNEAPRTFTQDEVNRMISDRLRREKDTLEAYKANIATWGTAALTVPSNGDLRYVG